MVQRISGLTGRGRAAEPLWQRLRGGCGVEGGGGQGVCAVSADPSGKRRSSAARMGGDRASPAA